LQILRRINSSPVTEFRAGRFPCAFRNPWQVCRIVIFLHGLENEESWILISSTLCRNI